MIESIHDFFGRECNNIGSSDNNGYAKNISKFIQGEDRNGINAMTTVLSILIDHRKNTNLPNQLNDLYKYLVDLRDTNQNKNIDNMRKIVPINHTNEDTFLLQFSTANENDIFKNSCEPKLDQNGDPIEINIIRIDFTNHTQELETLTFCNNYCFKNKKGIGIIIIYEAVIVASCFMQFYGVNYMEMLFIDSNILWNIPMLIPKVYGQS